MEINGIAHIQLTVGDFEACKPFYARLLPFLGLTPVMDADGFYYCVGARTGVARSRAPEAHRGEVLALLGYYSSVAMGVKLHRVPVPA